MKYIDENSQASDPVNITLSKVKMKELRPDLFGVKGYIKMLINKFKYDINMLDYFKEHIFYGDSQPAVVVSLKPLKVAAYSDELDCVAILEFPNSFIAKYGLELNDRLITVNTYGRNPIFQEDLLIGPNYMENWTGFSPIIAEFVSDDIVAIENRKTQISEDLWGYVKMLGLNYIDKNPNLYRDGRPGYSSVPAKIEK